MDRILQKLEDYKKRVEMLEADILTKDATIIELTASVENKEEEIDELQEAPMVTYTWSTGGAGDLYDTARALVHCTYRNITPRNGWKGAYEAVKLAHADWVKNHRDESDQFHYGYGALLSAALLLAKGFDKHQRDNINTWLWNYWEVQANQCNRA